MATQRSLKVFAGIALGLMIFLSLGIAMHGYGFQLRISGSPTFHERFDHYPVTSTMHVLGGATVLLLGGFQFWGGLRRSFPALHRNMGRVYLVFVLVGGIGGLLIAPKSDGGVSAHVGFGLLAVIWLFSGLQAYLAIRRGDVATHRAWMIRNFSLTFGAVTLRVYLGAMTAFGIPFEEAYPTVAWVSWVPNLILVEWYLALFTASRRPARSGSVEPSHAHGATA
ncbi:MAG: DUF2306 domain-containing protein [Pseudomonadales bacterium]|nr:DUF2306 domain-containing protein [Pseudomonadales bacterium]